MATVSDFKIDIDIIGDQKVKQAADQVANLRGKTEQLDNTLKKTKPTVSEISNAMAGLGGVAGQAIGGINALAGSMTAFAGVVTRLPPQVQGVLIAVAALGAVLSATVGSLSHYGQVADDLVDTAASLGQTAGDVKAFQEAVLASGGSLESASKGLVKFNENLGKAQQNDKGAVKAFQNIGVSLNDLATLSEKEILDKTIQGIANLDTKGKQAAAGVELLGRGFKGVDAEALAINLTLKSTDQSFNDAAITVAEFQSAQEELDNYMKTTGIKTTAEVADAWRDASGQSLKDWIEFRKGMFDLWNSIKVFSVQTVGVIYSTIKSLIGLINSTINLAINAVLKAANFAFEQISNNKLYKALGGERIDPYRLLATNGEFGYTDSENRTKGGKGGGGGQAVGSFDNPEDKKGGIDRGGGSTKVKELNEIRSVLPSVIEAQDRFSKVLGRSDDNIAASNESLLFQIAQYDKIIERAKDGLFISQKELDLERALNNVEIERTKGLAAIQKETDDQIDTLNKLIRSQEEYIKRTKNASPESLADAQQTIKRAQEAKNKATLEGALALAEYNKKTDEQSVLLARQSEIYNSLEGKVAEYGNGLAKTLADSRLTIFTKTIDGLADAFTNFALTGKLSLNSLLNDIISFVVSSSIKLALFKAFSGGIFGIGGGGGGGSFGLPVDTGYFGSLAGKATGGPVAGGQAIVVGEQGEEIFTPSTNGYITPNNQTGGGGGGMTQYIINRFEIDNIDSQSLEDRIYGISETIARAAIAGQQRIAPRGAEANMGYNAQYLIDTATKFTYDRYEPITQNIASSGQISYNSNKNTNPYLFDIGIVHIDHEFYSQLRTDLQKKNRNVVWKMLSNRNLFQGTSFDLTNVRTPGLLTNSIFKTYRSLGVVPNNNFTITLFDRIPLTSLITNYSINLYIESDCACEITLRGDLGQTVPISLTSTNLIYDNVINLATTRPRGGSTISLSVATINGTTPELQITADVLFYAGTVNTYTQSGATLTLDTSQATGTGYLFKRGDWIQLSGCRYPVVVQADIPFVASNALQIPIDREIPFQENYNQGGKGIKTGFYTSANVIITELPSFDQTPSFSSFGDTLKLYEVT